MRWLGKVWGALADENHRGRLALLGSAAAVAVAGGWQLYLHVAEPKALTAQQTRPAVAETDIAAGRVAAPRVEPAVPAASSGAGGDVNVQVKVKSAGDYDGETGIRDVDVTCADNATISSIVEAQGTVSGSNIISGGTFIGKGAAVCEAAD